MVRHRCQASRHPVGKPTGPIVKKKLRDVISADPRSSSEWEREMATRTRPAAEAMARVLVLKRAFDANPNVVFAAWTSEERLLRWFGMDSCMIDARAGGMFRFALRFPDGADRWVRGNYLEVVDGERIVFTSAEEDRNGAPGHETL